MWRKPAQKCQSRLAGALTGGVVLAVCLLPQSAEAQSSKQICRSLNAQLATIGSGRAGGNPAQYRRYDGAVRNQQKQISKARRGALRNGCVGIFSNRNSQCKQLTATIGKMERNLKRLQRERIKHAPSNAGNSGLRRNILNQLRRNNCDGKRTETRQAKAKSEKPRRKSLLEQVFGVRTYRENGSKSQEEIGNGTQYGFGGTYRTLCVRKQDGYYFPISFSTTQQFFPDDEETCRAMCPTSDVALYVHRMPSQDSEDMVSFRSQRPYASEPFAFTYRKKHDASAACRFATAGVQLTELSVGQRKKYDPSLKQKVWVPPYPAKHSSAFAAPGDNFEERAGLDEQVLKDLAAELTASEKEILVRGYDGQKKVRIVGPAFFPVQ